MSIKTDLIRNLGGYKIKLLQWADNSIICQSECYGHIKNYRELTIVEKKSHFELTLIE